jgi:hypothetical protein
MTMCRRNKKTEHINKSVSHSPVFNDAKYSNTSFPIDVVDSDNAHFQYCRK